MYKSGSNDGDTVRPTLVFDRKHLEWTFLLNIRCMTFPSLLSLINIKTEAEAKWTAAANRQQVLQAVDVHLANQGYAFEIPNFFMYDF